MKCPICNLINPETAQRCDCGYDFISGKLERSYLSQSEREIIQAEKIVDYNKPIGLIKCPNCGTLNCIGIYDNSVRPICGRCRSSLKTAIESFADKKPSFSQQVASKLKSSNKLIRIFFGIALIMVLLYLILDYFPAKQDNQTGLENKSYEKQQKQVKLNNKSEIEQPKRTIQVQQPPKTNRRLANGTIIYKGAMKGLGKLTVKNGLSSDAVAKIIDRKTEICKAYFYISSERHFTLTGIDDGHYRLIFGTGEDLDPATRFFRYNKSFSEFDKLMVFKTFKESREHSVHTKYTVLEVTLHPVLNGNIRTNTIYEAEFLKY